MEVLTPQCVTRLTAQDMDTNNERLKALRDNAQYRIGMQLADIRKVQGITQTQLAEMTGMKQQTIQRVESGLYSPSIGLLTVILEALGHEIRIKPKPKRRR